MVHKSMEPGKVHLWVLRELVGKVAKTLCIIFDKLWQPGKIPSDWKKVNIPHLEREKKEGLSLCPGRSRKAHGR